MIKKDIKKTTVYYSIYPNENGSIDIHWWDKKWKAIKDQEECYDTKNIDETHIGIIQTYVGSNIHKLAKKNQTSDEAYREMCGNICPDSDDPVADFERMSRDNDIPGFRD